MSRRTLINVTDIIVAPALAMFVQTERDVSVRQRAVDLLYAMCDRTNAEDIVGEMLEYLEMADYSIREEMVSVGHVLPGCRHAQCSVVHTLLLRFAARPSHLCGSHIVNPFCCK